MKKLNLLRTFVLLSLSMVVFTGCQKDTEDLLIGRWKVVGSEDVYYSVSSDGPVRWFDQQINQYFIFEEDGRMMGFLEWGTWNCEADKIYMVLDNEEMVVEITSLEKDKMSLYFDFGMNFDCHEYTKLDLVKVD